MGKRASASPPPHEVRLQLQRMLAREEFTSRPQQARLFKFIVQEALRGREITEKLIRERIFPTPPYKVESNIARMTVELVRRLLAAYYAGHGETDPVIITLPQWPKGKSVKPLPGTAYKPNFTYNPIHPAEQQCRLGLHHLSQQAPANLRLALEHFEKAIELHPGHAPGHVGMAETCCTFALYLPLVPPVDAISLAHTRASSAVELSPGYWRAHAALAAVLFYERQWEQAHAEFAKALKLDREEARNYPWYAAYLLASGKAEDALGIVASQASGSSDPLSKTTHGMYLYMTRRFDQAEAALSEALTLDRHFWLAHFVSGLFFMSTGRYQEALKHLKWVAPLVESESAIIPGLIALCASKTGAVIELEYAAQVSKLLRQEVKDYRVPPLQSALTYLGAGKTKEAIVALERACDEFDPVTLWLHVWPLFDPIREHPAFRALLRRTTPAIAP